MHYKIGQVAAYKIGQVAAYKIGQVAAYNLLTALPGCRNRLQSKHGMPPSAVLFT